MPKVTNLKYRSYLNRELVNTIGAREFTELLKNVKHKQMDQARAFCIFLWATAARPNELLRLKGEDVTKEAKSRYITINLPGSKGSLPRSLTLPMNKPLIKEAYEYAKAHFPPMPLFPALISHRHRRSIFKTGKKGKRTFYGPEGRGYVILESKLYYFFMRWFGIPPYLFRHNRLTIAAEKLNVGQLKQLKGAKTEASVWPYTVMTKKAALVMGKELVK